MDGELLSMEKEALPIKGEVTNHQFKFIKSVTNLKKRKSMSYVLVILIRCCAGYSISHLIRYSLGGPTK
ncbi:unnamed protein product [Absidia cylindrospora]